MKVFRNIYVKKYSKFPYQKLHGSKTLLYSGKIICGISELPPEYNSKLDFYIDCDCEFSEWRNLKRVL